MAGTRVSERITRSFHRLRNIASLVDSDGRPRGLTAKAFTSVLLDPPPLLACIARGSASYDTFQGPGGFAINVPSEPRVTRRTPVRIDPIYVYR